MRTPRVTLSGYYGFGNSGDEAVLAGLVKSLREKRAADTLEITALSINPAETRAAHGITSAHRYKAYPVLRALGRTDLLLSGGGSLLQDTTSRHGIFYYLGIVRAAQIMGKKTMFIAQGIGPLRNPISRKLTAAVANRLDAITVRDTASAALLREIGVTRTSIEVTADPALLLGVPKPASNTDTPTFGIALRPWPGQADLALRLAEACGSALHGHPAIVIPMQPQSDQEIADQFAQAWRDANGTATCIPPGTDLASLTRSLAACQMVIGMRLHALILAAASGIPSVALSYDPKVAAFMAQSGQSDAVFNLENANWRELPALLANFWAERAPRAAALAERLPALRAAAGRNAEVALMLVDCS